ncbi:DUF2630 family protein [Streptomyces sp. NPDC094468]|uniref:DUF2630 family protein n=1 Tax=Streptomyces sp. NPDC094468 TaxID=3366066 RepID=UPI003807820F
MEEDQILSRIAALVADRRRLRDAVTSGEIDTSTEDERLANLEEELDRCWDLLRQRRAKSEFGENPDEAQARSSSQVEGYLS